MLNGDFQEGNTIVPIITPVDFSTGANTGTPVNMAGYERAVFVLRKRDGLSYTEIARALDISVHTVKKYLARAVAQCRSARWER